MYIPAAHDDRTCIYAVNFSVRKAFLKDLLGSVIICITEPGINYKPVCDIEIDIACSKALSIFSLILTRLGFKSVQLFFGDADMFFRYGLYDGEC